MRENFPHQCFSAEEALCAYILGRSNGNISNYKQMDYSDSAEILNALWHDSKPLRYAGQIKSLMGHCYQNKLHLMDFLSLDIEVLFRKILKIE